MSQPPGLSKRESQIMDIIYALGEASATQVMAGIPDPLSRAAVRTFLRILEEKGHLKHRQEGREYVYIPIQERQGAGRSALRRVLDVFFGGSMDQAMAAYLADSRADLKDEDLQRIAAMIRKARKEGK